MLSFSSLFVRILLEIWFNIPYAKSNRHNKDEDGVYLQEDIDGHGYISCLQVLLALKTIIPPELLSDQEEIYVYKVCVLDGANTHTLLNPYVLLRSNLTNIKVSSQKHAGNLIKLIKLRVHNFVYKKDFSRKYFLLICTLGAPGHVKWMGENEWYILICQTHTHKYTA